MIGAPVNALKVIDYAWADPGEGIATGQKGESTDEVGAVPQSGSLGLLALGAVGLRAWRKQRS
jgi:MYXO-CTERM domain-containing protein